MCLTLLCILICLIHINKTFICTGFVTLIFHYFNIYVYNVTNIKIELSLQYKMCKGDKGFNQFLFTGCACRHFRMYIKIIQQCLCQTEYYLPDIIYTAALNVVIIGNWELVQSYCDLSHLQLWQDKLVTEACEINTLFPDEVSSQTICN